jgi:hypothetical protein
MAESPLVAILVRYSAPPRMLKASMILFRLFVTLLPEELADVPQLLDRIIVHRHEPLLGMLQGRNCAAHAFAVRLHRCCFHVGVSLVQDFRTDGMIRWLSLGRSSAMNKIGFDGALCCTPSSASLGHASNISAR